MSLESHLTELLRRHQAIDTEIAENETHPSVDALKLHELKRRKLQIKDEIEKVKSEAQRATKH
jgi:hypothetical protein